MAMSPSMRSEEHTSELQSRRDLLGRRPTSTSSPYTTLFRSNAVLFQNLRLQGFHLFSVGIVLVVVADQMQKAVDRKMAQMMRERLSLLIGLALGRLIGDGDVAEHEIGRAHV